jgi:hypothetical protein
MTKYEVPSTAEAIKNFLIDFAPAEANDILKPKGEGVSASNYYALNFILPQRMVFAQQEADDDMAHHHDKLGTEVTSYGNVRDAIPTADTIAQLPKLAETLNRVAKTRMISDEDLGLIKNANDALDMVGRFAKAHKHELDKHRNKNSELAAEFRARAAAIPIENELDALDRQTGGGPYHQIIIRNVGIVHSCALMMKEDQATLAIISHLKAQLGDIDQMLNKEVAERKRKSRY